MENAFQIVAGGKEIDFQWSRHILLDADTLGQIRREIFWTVGEDGMFGIMVRIGLSLGQISSAENRPAIKRVTNLLGRSMEIQNAPESNEYILEIKNSLEADEHLRFFPKPVKNHQCWLLAGFFSGAFSPFLGKPLYFLESHCRARGDSVCRFVGKLRSSWPPEFQKSLSYFDEDNLAMELIETKEQLQLTKDRYQNLFEQANVAIFIIDPDTGVYLDANLAACELTGYVHADLQKMTIFDLSPPDQHHSTAHYMKAINAQLPPANHELQLVRKDGEIRTIIQSSKVLTYGGRRVIQTSMRDVTDLKESEQKEKHLQQQLIRSERLSSIGRLAAGVAHELKNPLGAIRNAIYYIRGALANSDLLQTDPNLKEIMSLAESEVDGSVRIIGELLDFSRVVELMPRQTDINSLLEQIPNHVPIPDDVKLVLDLDPTLPQGEVDPERLRQVFTNIVTNASQAMPKGGTITIKSRLQVETRGEDQKDMEYIVVVIEDTGTGIEPIHLKKIFEPLFTTKARGTGLGLAITNNIIEKHGGGIQVASQVGKGTSFTVKLPRKVPSTPEEKPK